MIYHADYFVGGQHLGRSAISSDFAPHSLAYFCKTCGEIWARILITAEGVEQHWSVEFTPCLQHQSTSVLDWGAVPGTLLAATYNRNMLSIMQWGRALEHLPHAAVLREAAVLFHHHERQNHEQR